MNTSNSSITISEATSLPVREAALVQSAERVGRFYQPGLDVLRCLAFFLVLTHHSLPKLHTGVFGWWDAFEEFGNSGVCLFFTLSAFLITSLLLREEEQTGTIHIKAFYVRRILRIWPLYFAMIALGVLVPHIYHHFPRGEQFVVPYLLMSGNWALVWFGGTKNTIFAPLWSISVEEQFYVIWPALFLFFRKRGVIVAGLFLLPLAWITDYSFPSFQNISRFALWCNSFSQFQFFALGGLLAVVLHRRTIVLPFVTRLVGVMTGLALFLVAPFLLSPQNQAVAAPLHLVAGYLLIDLGCIAFLFAFMNAKLPKSCSPLVYLGKISYGLYVFHMFILGAVVHVLETSFGVPLPQKTWLAWALTTMIVIPLATLSYEYFEKPFLRLKDRFTFVKSRAA